MTERDLIRRLEKTPVPPPPEDLAARIINDIPAEVELHPELEHEGHRRRFHRRPVWMAAAAAVTIALTGAVTWELRHERPSIEMAGEPKHQSTALAPVDEVEETITGRMIESDGVLSQEQRLQETTDTDKDQKRRSAAPVAISPEDFLPAPSSARPPSEVTQDKVDLPSSETEGEPGTNLVIVMKPATFADQIIVAEGARVDPAIKLKEEGFTQGVIVVEEVMPVVDTRGILVTEDSGGARSNGRTEEKELYREVQPFEAGKSREKSTRAPIVVQGGLGATADTNSPRAPRSAELNKSKVEALAAQPSTGGTAKPNDKPYGDVFFEHTGVNPFVDAEEDSLSTFGLDVDTGSFTVARRYLRDGNLPPRAAIRVEEFVNSFDYGDEPPRKGEFRLIAEGAPSAFAAGERTYTLRLAVKAREVDAAARPPAVLVFCVDVSGSMNRENRLGLVKKALFELLENLRRDDHVGLVVYGSSGRILLKPTTDHEAIRQAVQNLAPGGATNAEQGLVLAYDLLSDGDDDGRLRRVILCSDGVANVGRTGPDSILERIRREAGEGIELTTVGFGMGNYNDTLMEQLADSGNGRYAYVDGLSEARRIFVEELTGTLMTLGHDAKAQVEFDPEVVSRWRLLGYENRDIADHLFRDPSVDAGEIGAGHTVTALYEVKLRPGAGRRDRIATLHLRYRPMGENSEREFEETLRVSQLADRWDDASQALQLASTVAEFAEILKGAYWAKDGDLDTVLRRVQHLQTEDFEGDGRVAELGAMVARARALMDE